MTVQDLIEMALRKIGATDHGRVSGPSVLADGLAALNAMVDAWANERLMIYTTARNIYNLAIGQQVYQIGPAGPDWIAPRPQTIDAAGLLIVNSDPTQSYERPLHIVRDDKEWARVRIKGLQSTLPAKLYYDRWYSNPNSATNPVGSGNIALWPCPSQANQIALYTTQTVQQFTSLTQTIALPPGYARALPYNLAVEMAPEFAKEPSDVVVGIAMESKAGIKRMNVAGAIGRLRVDPALRSHGGRFDILIGEER